MTLCSPHPNQKCNFRVSRCRDFATKFTFPTILTCFRIILRIFSGNSKIVRKSQRKLTGFGEFVFLNFIQSGWKQMSLSFYQHQRASTAQAFHYDDSCAVEFRLMMIHSSVLKIQSEFANQKFGRDWIVIEGPAIYRVTVPPTEGNAMQ